MKKVILGAVAMMVFSGSLMAGKEALNASDMQMSNVKKTSESIETLKFISEESQSITTKRLFSLKGLSDDQRLVHAKQVAGSYLIVSEQLKLCDKKYEILAQKYKDFTDNEQKLTNEKDTKALIALGKKIASGLNVAAEDYINCTEKARTLFKTFSEENQ